VKEVPIITAWNKADAVADPAALYQLASRRPNTVAISGASGAGLEQLLEAIAGRLQESMTDMEVGQDPANILTLLLAQRLCVACLWECFRRVR
jgi:50S ribosomal subunit-associated GTPase HflX